MSLEFSKKNASRWSNPDKKMSVASKLASKNSITGHNESKMLTKR